MASMRSVASDLAYYLGEELDFDRRQCDTVRYGLEIVLGTLIKAIVIFSISYVLGIVPLVFVVVATSVGLRVLSGGAHLNTYGRCLIFTTTASIGISYAAIVTSPLIGGNGLKVVAVGVAVIGLSFVAAWAPADHPNKPIKSAEKRKKYKSLSRIYIITWAVIIFVASSYWQTTLSQILCLASAMGLLLQVASVSPMSYRLFSLAEEYIDGLRA